MTVNGPDHFTYKNLLSPVLLKMPAMKELADVCNEVLGREVEERRRRLAKSRDSVKNRKGDILSQIEYWPEADKPAIDLATGDAIPLVPGERIGKAKIIRVINNTGLRTTKNQGLPDYFEVEFTTPTYSRVRWLMPINVPQERSIMIKNAYLMGFDFYNTSLSDEDYQRLYEYLGMFWPENGIDDNFIKFIGFIKNLKLEMEELWSLDNGTDEITVLEQIHDDSFKASNGGSWYLTSHVEVLYSLREQSSDYEINLDEIEKLFYLFAPIMLVLERITGYIDELLKIYIGSAAQAEIINYSVMSSDIDVITKITDIPVVQAEVINYASMSHNIDVLTKIADIPLNQAEIISYSSMSTDLEELHKQTIGLLGCTSVINYGIIQEG
jgi:hypothetical protein